MVKLSQANLKNVELQSSKGNQLKWESNHIWYKADYAGYEGLVEYVVSNLLTMSSLRAEEYVLYETEQMQYNRNHFLGCKSENFMSEGWQLITLERLFKSKYGRSFLKSIYAISGVEDRIEFLVRQTERMTKLKEFGVYLSKLFVIDALFLNEDRHLHNIAVLMNEAGEFMYCPIFDNGAALLSDVRQDYPLDADTETLIKEVQPKTVCMDFDEQLDAVEHLYGNHLQFSFSVKDVQRLLDAEVNYAQAEKDRVLEIIEASSVCVRNI